MNLNSQVGAVEWPGTLEKFRRARGFTLVELLAVLVMMALLTVLAVPSLRGLNQAGGVTNSGNQLVDLVAAARQNAIARNAPTALVVVTDSGVAEADYRAFSLWECRAGEDVWRQVTKWEMFAPGVRIDAENDSAAFLNNSPPTAPELGALPFRGRSLTAGGYAYQVFLPDGSMERNAEALAPVLRIVSEKNNGNYYRIAFNLFTGGVRIQRP